MGGDDDVKQLLQILLKGRQAERHEAQKKLQEIDESKRVECRKMILEALRTRYSASPISQVQSIGFDMAKEAQKTWDRAWLASSLGRIVGDDLDAKKVLLDIIGKKEPSAFVRFWAFEGFLQSKDKDWVDVAKEILQETDELKEATEVKMDPGKEDLRWNLDPLLWLRRLALAKLVEAEAGKPEDVQKWRDELLITLRKRSKATLRALRFASRAEFVPELCRILFDVNFSEEQEPAIRALGKTEPGTSEATSGSHAIGDFIESVRMFEAWDTMRVRALEALGDLRDTRYTSVLLEELTDLNPAIVKAAAQALEKMLGTEDAVKRIVVMGAALKGPAATGHIKALGQAVEWMSEKTTDVLTIVMVSGTFREQEIARTILLEIGGPAAFQRLHAQRQYAKALEEAQVSLRMNYEQAFAEFRKSHNYGRKMDTVQFILGVGLIITGFIMAIVGGELITEVLGSFFGATGIVTSLHAKFLLGPRGRIREEAEYSMHLHLVFQGYLRRLQQIDSVFTRRLLEEREFPIADVNQFGKELEDAMNKGIKGLSKYKPSKGFIEHFRRKDEEKPEEQPASLSPSSSTIGMSKG